MILATINDRTYAFIDGRIESPPDNVLPKALERPVLAVRGVERTDDAGPVNERVQVSVEPGTGEHFRAVVTKLGGTIEFDGGDA